jgi:hypothetical protein
MYITLKGKNDRTIESLADFIRMKINNGSRFELHIDILSARRLKMRNIRLKEKKRYCGNHPNACDIEGGRMGRYLEGLDWVEFNDRINDILDYLDINARVYSSVCEVRAGKKRRTNYGSHLLDHLWRPVYQWDKKGEACDYEDCCGIYAPDSDYPYGTPGDYEERKPLYA